RVEFDVGARLQRLFGAARDRSPLRPFAFVASLFAVQGVGAAAADDRVVAGAAVDHVGALGPDQGVLEGRAFDALEAEQLVVAVAAGEGFGERDGVAAAAPGGDVGRERGDVADA